MTEAFAKVGDRIRTLRKQHDFSQLVLAERAGISYKYLGEVERGQVNLSIDVLSKIAKALHVNPGDLLDEHVHTNDEVTQACFIISELPAEKVSLALDLLRALQKHS